MSNLDADIRQAMALGYGIHYGKYKADHPKTAAKEKEPAKEAGMLKCLECNKNFMPRRKGMIYCCKLCQDRRNHRMNRQKKMEERNDQTMAE